MLILAIAAAHAHFLVARLYDLPTINHPNLNMLLSIVLTAVFGVIWLGATFWLLSRAAALRQSGTESRLQRKWEIAGEVQVHLPTFIAQLRRGERPPIAVPFLVTSIAALGFIYSMFSVILVLALSDRNFIIAGLIALSLVYVTIRLVIMVFQSAQKRD